MESKLWKKFFPPRIQPKRPTVDIHPEVFESLFLAPPENWITKGGILKTSWFCSSLNNHHDKWVIEVLQFGLVDCHSANQNWLLIKSDHLGTLNSSSSFPLPWVWEEKYHAKNICFFLPYICVSCSLMIFQALLNCRTQQPQIFHLWRQSPSSSWIDITWGLWLEGSLL